MAGRTLIRALAALAVGSVFLAAGLLKLGDLPSFAEAVHRFQLTPRPLSTAIAYFLPWLEVLAALALLLPTWRAAALHILLALSLGFAIVLTSAWTRDLNINCGCFGPSAAAAPNYPLWILRALLLALAAFLGLPPAAMASAPHEAPIQRTK